MNIEELKRLAEAANAKYPNPEIGTDEEFRSAVLALEEITTPSMILGLITEIDRLKYDAEANRVLLVESRQNDYHAMAWLADCRFAVGDDGKRMLPEFVEHLKDLKRQRDELLAALKGMVQLDIENHQRGDDDIDIAKEVQDAYNAIANAERQP